MKILNILYYLILQPTLLLCLVEFSYGQGSLNKYSVSGTVSDQSTQEKLPGVNVYLKGTTIGASTDIDGFFSLMVTEGKHTLVFSFVGYITQEKEITVTSNKIMNLSLEPQKEILGEVRVTLQRMFFGNMEYGREIPNVKAEVIGQQNTNNASDVLHARIAGVWATKTSGAPGDHQKIRIRGQNSLFTSAEPLYVIDGVPVPIVNLSSLGISDLNIHDIDNVTVLKDASSTALYGFQGGNGVVLVDTKQGGKNEINFSTKFGYQWFDHFYDLMTSEEQLASFNAAQANKIDYLKKYYPALTDSLCNHDRQGEIFSPGSVQEYQLSASGSYGKLKYYLSGNYTDQRGILHNSEYKRYTFSARIGRSFGKRVVINLAYRGSRQENDNNQDEYKGNRLLFDGVSTSPCLECTPDSLLYDNYRNAYKRIFILMTAFMLAQPPSRLLPETPTAST